MKTLVVKLHALWSRTQTQMYVFLHVALRFFFFFFLNTSCDILHLRNIYTHSADIIMWEKTCMQQSMQMNCLPFCVIGVLFVGYVGSLPPANLTCSSTLDSSAVCYGDTINCSLQAPCQAMNLSVKVNGKDVDDAYLQYGNETIMVLTRYLALVSSSVEVEMVSTVENCTFVAAYVTRVSGQCRYPFLLRAIAQASGTTALDGGKTFSLRYVVSALSPINNISLVTFHHPAVQVLNVSSNVPTAAMNGTLNAIYGITTDTDEIEEASFLVYFKNLTSAIAVEVNVTCYLHRYVRAGAKLYFDLFAAYTYLNATLVQTVRDNTYTAALPFAHHFTLKLPLHAPVDYTQRKRVIATNDGDLFSSEISVKVPCVSTDLNVSIVVPNYYVWLNLLPCIALNITDFRVARMPYDLYLVSNLCEYSSCPNVTGPIRSNISYTFVYSDLNTVLTAVIGPSQYRETAAGSISENCTDADIRIALTGIVMIEPTCRYNVCDILREDNVTVVINSAQESTSSNWAYWTSPLVFQAGNDTGFNITIGGPEVELFIYSSIYQGDAGDSLVLTFGVAPLQWYSVYKANVTFWIDTRYVAADEAEFCLYNGTVGQPFCQMVAFENQRMWFYFEK